MEEYLIRAATNADLIAITALANDYTFEKLSEEDREAGFLTGRFELPAMQKMVASASSLVAIYQHTLVGFIINSKLPLVAYPPLVQSMIQKFPELQFKNRPLTSYRYFFYGPVLVSKFHRGKKLLQQMFHQTRQQLRGRLNLGIAFIHAQNQNSLHIHTKSLGLEILGQFTFNDENYHILAFSVD